MTDACGRYTVILNRALPLHEENGFLKQLTIGDFSWAKIRGKS
jgi:hypothetical protein